MALTMLRRMEGGVVGATSSVLSPSEVGALITADELVQQAIEHSRALTDKASAAAERAYREAYELGLDEGRAAAAKAFVGTTIELSRHARSLESYVLRSVMLGIRTILGETPPDDLMRRLVHRALEQVQTPGSLTVHVHSDDTGAAAQAISSLSGSDSTTIRIVADPRLVRASCRIESEFGSIEAGLASQLDAIESALSTLARERGVNRPASDPNGEAGPE